ncbi:MAG: class I SAM-dependent methyltransferase [Pseudomonadota bacterium]
MTAPESAESSNESAAALLRQAEQLEQSNPRDAGRLFFEALQRDPGCLNAHNALERLNDPKRYSAWMKINCTIHPNDDIYRFIASNEYSHNPVRDYLADGWRTLAETMRVLEQLDRPLTKLSSVLEFASGFGRFTRHLAPLLPGRVTCSDVLPDTMRFAAEQFGVTTFESSFEPDQLEFPRQYELVFVLSLFTHLPVTAWPAWFKALGRAVEPGGVLLFSVHNEGMTEQVSLNEEGYRFFPASESPSLDPNHYGTTVTTRQLVLDQVQTAFHTEPALYRPGAYWVGQDAVAVIPKPV